MGERRYPWRPLGGLLVERGLLTEDELSQALVEQRVTGRLLGQILVDREYLSGFTLTRALVEQHGVDLRSKASPPQVPTGKVHGWMPLGRLLVQHRLVDERELEQALLEQRREGRRLGEILVARGYLTGLSLARALAEQHGLDGTRVHERAGLEASIAPAGPVEVVYRVAAPAQGLVFESANFLEAADVAAELVGRDAPGRVELRRLHGEEQETVWTSEDAGDAPSLVDTFGFDPTRWGSGLSS